MHINIVKRRQLDVSFLILMAKKANSLSHTKWMCKYHILVALAGKAAVGLYYSETCASGCQSDIRTAYKEIRNAISESGTVVWV